MAKKPPKRAKKSRSGGPYLAAAFFCERTMEDKQDSAISVTRIIDQLSVVIPPNSPPNFPSKETPLVVPVSAFVSFKSGDSPGDHTIRLQPYSPSGKFGNTFEQTIRFTEKPQGGANLRINFGITVTESGLFWLDVILDGRRVTRMPIEISVSKSEVQEGMSAETRQEESVN